MATHVVKEGQDIWDILIQEFGQVDDVFTFLADNPTLDINTTLSSGDILTINADGVGNLKVKQALKTLGVEVMNVDEDTLFTFTGVTFTIDGNTVARTNTKSGAALKWNIDGTIYSQVNTPAHTYGVGPGVGQLTSSDGWSGLTVFDMSGCNLVAIDLSNTTSITSYKLNLNSNLTGVTFPTSSAVITNLRVDNNGLVGALNLSTLSNLGGTVQFNGNSALTSVSFPTSSQTISSLEGQSCNITGVLTLETMTGLGGVIFLNSNANMTKVIMPTSSVSVSYYWLYSCDLTGTHDASNMSGFGGNIRFQNNSNLTKFLNPTSSVAISFYYGSSCNLTGNHDFSGLSKLGGDIRLQGNVNMTSITFPTSSQTTTHLQVSGCDLTGTVDISTMLAVSGNVEFQDNANMTGFTVSTDAGATFTNINLSGCDLAYVDLTPWEVRSYVNNYTLRLNDNGQTTAEVNQELVNEDTDAITGSYTGRAIYIGGTNAAPDGSSGGYDGDAAVTSLIAKNFTVFTS